MGGKGQFLPICVAQYYYCCGFVVIYNTDIIFYISKTVIPLLSLLLFLVSIFRPDSINSHQCISAFRSYFSPYIQLSLHTRAFLGTFLPRQNTALLCSLGLLLSAFKYFNCAKQSIEMVCVCQYFSVLSLKSKVFSLVQMSTQPKF